MFIKNFKKIKKRLVNRDLSEESLPKTCIKQDILF